VSQQPTVQASAPGRVCLFGEHLDYLGLPVIAAAISLRMHVEGHATDSDGWEIDKPDLGQTDGFELGDGDLPCRHAGDFLRAAVNVLRREGVPLPRGAHFRVTGNVPIQAGTSSSSALQVAWIAALLALAGDPRADSPEAVAHLAYRSEVIEFDGSGGMMDQFTAAVGGLVRIDPGQEATIRRLPARLGAFVLGNSLEPKDTQAILSRVRAAAHRGAEWLRDHAGAFDWSTTPLDLALRALDGDHSNGPRADDRRPTLDDLTVTAGALRNRDLLEEGHALLSQREVDRARLGALLTAHHGVLRDSLGISTPKIERMLQAALDAGALGGKINGSGGGGCMFAYAPTRAEEVAHAIRQAGGEATIVHIAPGLTLARSHAGTLAP
jgi:galactokinase